MYSLLFSIHLSQLQAIHITLHFILSETTYESTATVSKWPSDQYWKNIALRLGYSNTDLDKNDEIKDTIQANYIKAEFYFKTFNVQTITQDAKYTVSVS